MLSGNYSRFYNDLITLIPDARLITDPLRTLAYGTDASFYRLTPQIVIKADSEAEVSRILQASDRYNIAGDRGFRHPELNQSALKELRPAVSDKCTAGYSTSRTCEIGLSQHRGLYYKSIVYLVDQCTRPI